MMHDFGTGDALNRRCHRCALTESELYLRGQNDECRGVSEFFVSPALEVAMGYKVWKDDGRVLIQTPTSSIELDLESAASLGRELATLKKVTRKGWRLTGAKLAAAQQRALHASTVKQQRRLRAV